LYRRAQEKKDRYREAREEQTRPHIEMLATERKLMEPRPDMKRQCASQKKKKGHKMEKRHRQS
jgi:hypothetical protein